MSKEAGKQSSRDRMLEVCAKAYDNKRITKSSTTEEVVYTIRIPKAGDELYSIAAAHDV